MDKKTINGQNLSVLWNRIKAYVNDRMPTDTVDSSSKQKINGQKTFTNGLTIGDEGVQLVYNARDGYLKFLFLNTPVDEEYEESPEAINE